MLCLLLFLIRSLIGLLFPKSASKMRIQDSDSYLR
jgi:hypothetical protein